MPKGYKPSSIPQFGKIMRGFRVEALIAATTATRRFMEGERTAFQAEIRAQRFASFRQHPLSPMWKAIKKAAGADRRVMIATGHYVSSIRTFMRKSGDTTTFRIGFAPNAHARTLQGRVSPMLLSDLAALHEQGNPKNNLPARPHWGPYLRGMRRRATLFARGLSERLARRGRKRIERGH